MTACDLLRVGTAGADGGPRPFSSARRARARCAARWPRRQEPSLAVALVGLTAATMLAMSWTHLRGLLIQAQRAEAKAGGT